MRNKGFTLIELILVIAILGILAVSALPKFIDVSTNAKQAARDGVVGAVRSGAALYKANQMVTAGGTGNYPTTLDSNANGACATCFDTVLSSGINDTNWQKSSTTTYTYNVNGTLSTFTWNVTNGTFQ